MLPYGLFVGGLWHCLPIWDWLWNLLGLITASSYTLADVHKFQPCESSIRPVAKSNQIRPICIKLCWSCLMQNTARIIKFREHFYFERQKFTLESISEFINTFGMWSKVLSSKVVKRGHMYFDTSGCNVSKLVTTWTTRLTNSIHSQSPCDQSMDELH